MTTATTTEPTPRVDERFASRLRPLTEAEWCDLGASLDRDGLLDPIICWRDPVSGELVVLDGHHRLRYCGLNSIPIRHVEVSLADEAEALAWIDEHQTGRRNLPEHVLSEMRGREYLAQKRPVGRPPTQSRHGDGVSAEAVAERHGVSPRTVERDAQYAQHTDAIAAVLAQATDADLDAALQSVRGAGLTRREAATLAESPPESPEALEAAVEQLRAPKTLRPSREPSDEGAWGQRHIRATHTATDERGAEYVTHYDLSCGHMWEARKKLPPNGRKTAPCEMCFPATRGAAAARRSAKAIERALVAAIDDPARLAELVSAVQALLQLTARPPRDARERKLHERAHQALRGAGVVDVDEVAE